MTDLRQETMRDFIEGLFVIRAFAGWSMETLAKMLCITKTTLGKIESLEQPVKPVYYLAIRKLVEDAAYEESCNGDAILGVVIHIMDNDSVLMTRDELFCYANNVIVKVGYKRGMKYIRQALRKEFRQWVS